MFNKFEAYKLVDPVLACRVGEKGCGIVGRFGLVLSAVKGDWNIGTSGRSRQIGVHSVGA